MIHSTSTTVKRKSARRDAFTLAEITIVIAVIAILAALALPVFTAAAQQAKVHRTRAIVAKLDMIIGEKWEAYRTRQVPIKVANGTSPVNAAWLRVRAMRELQRMELPDSISDIVPLNGSPVILISANGGSAPSLWRNYNRRALATWTTQYESAECLYLIVAATRDGDRSALDFFSKSEIGDTDGDGMNEILDAWGQPIYFLRWAPGYRADLPPYPATPQRRNDSGLAADPTTYPDPFDPFRVDARWGDNNFLNDPIALKPLIYSAGPDKKYEIGVSGTVQSATVPSPNDPYFGGGAAGTPIDSDSSGSLDHADNITNHDLEAK
jgi:prepilin-type N-terminal cleavage/methylation domain-containing protein